MSLEDNEDSDCLVYAYAGTRSNQKGPLLSDETNMTVPQVQGCLQRDEEMGADKNGNVPQQSLITDDPFSTQLVQQLPVSGNDLVSFQTYCRAVNWLAKSTLNDKLRGLYQMQSGLPLDQEALQGVLMALYPQEPPQHVGRLASFIMREVDVKQQGFIDETQFIWWMHRLPTETLKSMLRLSVLPDGTEEGSPAGRDLAGEVPSEEALDAQLHSIAREMATRKRDWRLLANCLGFLEQECRTIQRAHKGPQNQVLALLQQWRRGEEELKAAEELQAALRDSGNSDIRNEVFGLNFQMENRGGALIYPDPGHST